MKKKRVKNRRALERGRGRGCADLLGASKHGGGAGGAAVPGCQAGGGGLQTLHGVKQVRA